jgi:hypothetical protein
LSTGTCTTHDEAGHVVLTDGISQTDERLGHRRRDRSRSFDLYQSYGAITRGHNEVDFKTLTISEVVDLPSPAVVDPVFHDLRGDESFKERPEERRALQLPVRRNAEKMAGEARVDKIQLRRLF